MGRKLKDEEVIGAKGLEHIADLIAAMVPFVSPLALLRFPIPPLFDFDRGDEPQRAGGIQASSNESKVQHDVSLGLNTDPAEADTVLSTVLCCSAWAGWTWMRRSILTASCPESFLHVPSRTKIASAKN